MTELNRKSPAKSPKGTALLRNSAAVFRNSTMLFKKSAALFRNLAALFRDSATEKTHPAPGMPTSTRMACTAMGDFPAACRHPDCTAQASPHPNCAILCKNVQRRHGFARHRSPAVRTFALRNPGIDYASAPFSAQARRYCIRFAPSPPPNYTTPCPTYTPSPSPPRPTA